MNNVKKILKGGGILYKTKRPILIVLLLSLFLSFFSVLNPQHALAADLHTKLKDQLIPLKTTKAEQGIEDLMPLKEILKDKKVIGIGESTIGAKEFFEMRHRIIEFLVDEMDYKLLAVDVGFSEANIVNDYIQGGEASLDDAIWALKEIPWSAEKVSKDNYIINSRAYLASWTTTEVSDMLKWMREYNENSEEEDKLRFYGIDMELPESNIWGFFDYLHLVDSSLGTYYNRKLSDIIMVYGFNMKYPSSRPLNLFTGMMEELQGKFKGNRDPYISRSSENEYETASQALNTIIQWTIYQENNLTYGAKEAFNVREEFLAKNTEWILEHEKQFNNDKIIVLAHNNNIIKASDENVSMGENLRGKFNDKYYAIGLDFYQGRFRSYGLDLWGNPISNYIAKFNIKSSPKRTLVNKLEKTNIPISFMDFKIASEDKDIIELLSKKQSFHNIGLLYPGKYSPSSFIPDHAKRLTEVIPIESYDGFIFIKEITETTGVYDRRDTKIEDGDKAILNHYMHIIFGQLSTIIGIVIVLVFIIIFIRNKIRKKKAGVGARYPGSRRWD